MARKEMPKCSFCGRPKNELKHILVGPGANICSDCIGMASAELQRALNEKAGPAAKPFRVPKPHQIKAALDAHVIGQ